MPAVLDPSTSLLLGPFLAPVPLPLAPTMPAATPTATAALAALATPTAAATPAATALATPPSDAAIAASARVAGTGLAPASSVAPSGGPSSLLAVLASRGAPAPSANADALRAELTRTRGQLADVRAEIGSVQAQLDGKLAAITTNLDDARRTEASIARANTRLASKKRTHGVLGFLATAAAAVVFPPAISVVGLGALKHHIDLDQDLAADRRKLAEKQTERQRLERDRDGLYAQRSQLYDRASSLDTEIGALDRTLRSTQTLESLTAAHRRARAALTEGRAILADGHALSEKATALGVAVDQLRADLTTDLAAVEQQIAALDQQLERTILGLALSVAGAGPLAGLSAAQTTALKTALSAAAFFQTPEADRPAWLAQALAGVIAGPDAAPLVTRTIALLASVGADDRATAKAALQAGEAALTLAQRAWMRELVDTPDTTLPLAALVKSLLALGSADRDRAITNFARLSG